MDKIDFLNAITGKSVVREIEGIEVKIKSLTVLETQQLSNDKLSDVDAAIELIYYGLVDPKLDRNDLETFKNAKAGFVMKLAKAISEVSGLGDSETPTVGNGS